MTLENLHTITEDIIAKAENGKSEIATVIALHGDLGAGKTTLAQEIARTLSVKEAVISPTFVIMKKYIVVNKKFKYLIHIDAYRLTASEELQKLGWNEILSDKTNLVLIEWPENVPECIPHNALSVKLSHGDDNSHSIEF